jgi:hypothetical protein
VEGLSASVVLISILLGVLVLVVFDAFCLLRLGTDDTVHVVPRLVWAALIVCASPVGGLVYLLAQRLRKRAPEPIGMRPRPLSASAGYYGPSLTQYRQPPSSQAGHAIMVVAIAAVVGLAIAGQVLWAAAIVAVLVTIAFLRNTPPG